MLKLYWYETRETGVHQVIFPAPDGAFQWDQKGTGITLVDELTRRPLTDDNFHQVIAFGERLLEDDMSEDETSLLVDAYVREHPEEGSSEDMQHWLEEHDVPEAIRDDYRDTRFAYKTVTMTATTWDDTSRDWGGIIVLVTLGIIIFSLLFISSK